MEKSWRLHPALEAHPVSMDGLEICHLTPGFTIPKGNAFLEILPPILGLVTSSSWSSLPSLLVVQIQLAFQVWGIRFPAATKPWTSWLLGIQTLSLRPEGNSSHYAILRADDMMLLVIVEYNWNPANFEFHIAPNDPNVPNHIAILLHLNKYRKYLCMFCVWMYTDIMYGYIRLRIALVWGWYILPPI